MKVLAKNSAYTVEDDGLFIRVFTNDKNRVQVLGMDYSGFTNFLTLLAKAVDKTKK